MLGLRSAYEMVPLIILLEAVVLYIYSHDSQIVLKNLLTLTSSKAILSLFGSEFFFFFFGGCWWGGHGVTVLRRLL